MKEATPYVLITGATSSLGIELAKTFCQQGAHVLLHSRTKDNLTTTANALAEIAEPKGGSVSLIEGDMLQEADVRNIAEQVRDVLEVEQASLSAWINLVGPFGEYQTLSQYTIEQYDVVLNGNLRSAFLLLQLLLPQMQEKSRIVLFSAATADILKARKYTAFYHIAKFGISTLVRSYASELQERNMAITALAPGMLEENDVEIKAATHEKMDNADVVAITQYIMQAPLSEINGVIFPLTQATLHSVHADSAPSIQ